MGHDDAVIGLAVVVIVAAYWGRGVWRGVWAALWGQPGSTTPGQESKAGQGASKYFGGNPPRRGGGNW